LTNYRDGISINNGEEFLFLKMREVTAEWKVQVATTPNLAGNGGIFVPLRFAVPRYFGLIICVNLKESTYV